MVEVHPELDMRVRGLSGGSKEMWLRRHRSEVLRYLHDWGPEACRQRFNMRPRTLENFLLPDHKPVETLTKSDKAIMISKVAREDVAELRGEVRQLRGALNTVIPVCRILLQVGDAMAQLSQLRLKQGESDFEESRENEAK